MESRTFGHTTVTLPNLEEPGLYLTNVAALEASRGIVQDFQYMGVNVRSLELASTQLVTGRISGLRAERVVFDDVRVNGVEFVGCDLSSLQWRDSKLSRVVFRGCKIMGGMLCGLSLENVLFEKCRLDYATFEKVRAAGPVAFSECSLDEATFTECDLTGAAIHSCSLRSTDFGKGRYTGLDLRGSDLSQVAGAGHLNKVLITPAQADELTRALMADLEVSYGDPIRGDL
ncbi:pentapeptide repeat-containing protein [Streptomyces sp. 5.8]|uniref:pentapeptide repeat-containing protein n=1 Tax=Streptomyces sp. 5.8 TaxID=3406571 RepID=UPI003BB77728